MRHSLNLTTKSVDILGIEIYYYYWKRFRLRKLKIN